MESNPLFLVYALSSIVLAYFIGSFPTGFLLVKAKAGKDLRKIGSGSTGATNVRRVLGKGAFIQVMLFDFLKGFAPVSVAQYFIFPESPSLHIIIAIATVFGHSKSIFLGFTGGKSAATGLGTAFGLNPLAATIIALTAFLITKFSRMVSAGSLAAAVITVPAFILFNSPPEYVLYGLLTALYVTYLHRANISRLIAGTESKLD